MTSCFRYAALTRAESAIRALSGKKRSHTLSLVLVGVTARVAGDLGASGACTGPCPG